jgi:hypothetical protein
MTSPRIDLRIEELVLHGFELRDRGPIGEAVERELTRLLAGSRPLAPPPAQDVVDAGSFAISAGKGASDVGAQTARAVHGALTGRGS